MAEVWLVAEWRGGRWRGLLSAAQPAGAQDISAQAQAAGTDVNQVVSRAAQGLVHPLWLLEVAKFSAQNLAQPLAAAQCLADACASAGPVRSGSDAQADPALGAASFAVRLPVQHAAAARHALAAELNGQALAPPARVLQAAALVRYLAGLLLGLAAWLGVVLRHARGTRPAPMAGGTMLALYGELSNRTRHLLPPAFALDATSPVLVVGRPRLSLPAVAQAWSGAGGTVASGRLLRAIDWPSALGSLVGTAPGLLAPGAGVLACSSARLPVRECAALAFRMLQGACEARWWQRQRLRPELVLFGHTGLADTTQLERAMQALGARTVHCVHGASHGWNFSGASDLALFACGHDARMADRFPAYGKSMHLPLDCPAPRPGNGRWVVLTSYTHPMNPAYAEAGNAADRACLDAVAAAARAHGQALEAIVWKPHPAIGSVAAADAQALRAHAERLGLQAWPKDWSLERLGDASVVVTTPSTAAIDALLHGKPPVVFAVVPMQPDLSYAQLPLFTRDAAALEAAIGRVLADAPGEHARAWQQVQPGTRPTVAAVPVLLRAATGRRAGPEPAHGAGPSASVACMATSAPAMPRRRPGT